MAEKGCEDSLLEVEDEKQLLKLIKSRFLQDKVYVSFSARTEDPLDQTLALSIQDSCD